MSITREYELEAMKRISNAVAIALSEMCMHASPGISTHKLDQFGESILQKFGARSAPKLTYNFPGCTCISVNHEVAHGIPSTKKILKEGDLINIDVSAEKDGFWSDNGCSFVLGTDINRHQPLVDASRKILKKVIKSTYPGMPISELGGIIQTEARQLGYRVVRNLTGHGIGRGLHEAPKEIPNYRNNALEDCFELNSVVAIETFISTKSNYADTLNDGWTLVGDRGGFVAQHEHTLVITDEGPHILTEKNGIWN